MLHTLACAFLLFTSAQVSDVQAESPGVDLPVVRANSSSVALSVDDGPFMDGAWHLNPAVNPDVFRIGSALPYGTKKIVFRTDVDSISFNVEAGNEYDFVFLLNENVRCHTRIWARPNPAIWSSRLFGPICLSLLTIGVWVVVKWRTLRPRPLLFCGMLAPIVFWITTVVCAVVRGNYNHLENVISQLGEIGSRAEVLTSVLLIAVSVLCFLFCVGFYKSSKQLGCSVTPAVLSLSMPLSMLWAAIFPAHNDLHGMLGPLPLVLNTGALLAYFLWRKHEALTYVRRWSLVSFAFMMLLFLIFSGLQNYDGLIQRFWYFGWSVWFVSLSATFEKLSTEGARGKTV